MQFIHVSIANCISKTANIRTVILVQHINVLAVCITPKIQVLILAVLDVQF